MTTNPDTAWRERLETADCHFRGPPDSVPVLVDERDIRSALAEITFLQEMLDARNLDCAELEQAAKDLDLKIEGQASALEVAKAGLEPVWALWELGIVGAFIVGVAVGGLH